MLSSQPLDRLFFQHSLSTHSTVIELYIIIIFLYI